MAMDKGTYHQACLPDFNPWNPHGEEKNQLNLSSDLHVCTIVQLQQAHDPPIVTKNIIEIF